MQNELTCNQVIALMSFYAEDKLNSKLKQYVEEHLKKCSRCREVYLQSKKIAGHIISLMPQNDTTQFSAKPPEYYNLSAYVDNELNEIDSVKIRKIAISNPLARKNLEDMFTFKRLLHDSFERTRNEWKNDYSKIIINKLHKFEYSNTIDPFYKLIGAFAILIILVILGFTITLYF